MDRQRCLGKNRETAQESERCRDSGKKIHKRDPVTNLTPESSPHYGRLIHTSAVERIQKLLADNAAFILPSSFPTTLPDPLYVRPTICDFKHNFTAFATSSLMKSEVFGPILILVRYSEIDKVVSFINSREKPLSLYAFGR